MGDTYVYIIVSQTGTMLSRALKLAMGTQYNHASISLDKELRQMYSFGRLNPYNPVIGGFVQENPFEGTFARFPGTQAKILRLKVSTETYQKMRQLIKQFAANPKDYGYNYIGLFMGAATHANMQRKNHYFCSEFVRYILEESGAMEKADLPEAIHPQHFLSLTNAEEIYDGRLQDYGPSSKNKNVQLEHSAGYS